MSITTTELIALLQRYEKGGATGRSRELYFYLNDQNGNRYFITDMNIEFDGCGDGLFTDLGLSINGTVEEIEINEE